MSLSPPPTRKKRSRRQRNFLGLRRAWRTCEEWSASQERDIDLAREDLATLDIPLRKGFATLADLQVEAVLGSAPLEYGELPSVELVPGGPVEFPLTPTEFKRNTMPLMPAADRLAQMREQARAAQGERISRARRLLYYWSTHPLDRRSTRG